ncbi:MAG: carboxypeptidase-like regulatory domain-containing protein, partial [Bacteroidota bacterium]
MSTKLHKIAIIMSKITIYVSVFCLSLTMVFATATNAQQKKLREIEIELEKGSYPVSTLFKSIENETLFNFAYLENQGLNTATVSIKKKRWDMLELLKDISKQTELSFKRIDETITVRVEKVSETIPAVQELFVDQHTITGKITDENGLGLPGATVMEQGTSNGTTTDIDGNFKLDVSPDAILEITFIGYETLTIPVGSQTVINVQMQVDTEQLEEVVVIGYGVQKKSLVTGAISSIDTEELEQLPVANVEQALQGRTSGVVVTQNSGQPGSGLSIRIRGVGTNGNSQPLYIV